MLRTSKGVFKLLAFLIIAYGVLTFIIPPDSETVARYELSTIQLRLLQLTVVIPVALIWYAAAYGYVRFREYTNSIRKTPDGKAFADIVRGVGVLALGLPLSSFASISTNYIVRSNPEYVRWSTLFNHYLAIIIMLAAFAFIYRGAEKLQAITKAKQSANEWAILIGGFTIFALTYIYLLFSNPVRQTGDPNVIGQTIFFLPTWALILTMVVPYLYVWYIGLRSCVFLNTYQKKVKGVIYRQAVYLLSLGIGAVVAGSVSRQYIVAVSNLLVDLRLAPLLILVYSLLIVIAAGYILIAVGARKLKQIEEV